MILIDQLTQELTSLRTQLSEARQDSTNLREEIELASKAANKAEQERDQLKQQLLACEASRERMREAVKIAQFWMHDIDDRVVAALSEPPPLALTEALKGVRDALEKSPRLYDEASQLECTCDKSEHCKHCSRWEKADRLLSKALYNLDKLCPPVDPSTP